VPQARQAPEPGSINHSVVPSHLEGVHLGHRDLSALIVMDETADRNPRYPLVTKPYEPRLADDPPVVVSGLSHKCRCSAKAPLPCRVSAVNLSSKRATQRWMQSRRSLYHC
jgi:hypothetical protein